MIEYIIKSSIHNRAIVVLIALIVFIAGITSLKYTPVDAIPDLTDTQVIIKTSYPGQAPQIVEDLVTYPITTTMLSVPKSTSVRGFSYMGDSYVYVIFEDGTDLYWARSRVLEYLNQISSQLPQQAKPELGPDASGVGWIYSYAVVDKTGQHNLSELRSLQDWFLKFELQSLDGVAEIASVGGMVQQYQVRINPNKLRAFDIPLSHIRMAIKRANAATGASVIEQAEAEYMVLTNGNLGSLDNIRNIPLGINNNDAPLLLADIADVQLGPQMRRGIAELNGQGEVTGGIVVMRNGENADKVIKRVKNKLQNIQESLPEGVEIITTYDRSSLISSAVSNLLHKISIEFLVVAFICGIFLFHFGSSLVILISLPLGILSAFMIMNLQGINANIMSLGGIALAIGAMVDGAIVMIENIHRRLAEAKQNINTNKDGTKKLASDEHWRVVAQAACEVGPALFFSLIIITVSFFPIFALQGQEEKLFTPLAFTKTFAMAAAAILAITIVPVLIGFTTKNSTQNTSNNPINHFFVKLYQPLISKALHYPKLVVFSMVIFVLLALWPLSKLGNEFMPDFDEGDLMYMPTTYTGISIGEARQILQQTDKLIATIPEVKTVFGKIGRAETATDPAPLTMIETIIQFKPKNEWREGITKASLRQELNDLIQIPGLSNAWVMPIKTRIDMLTTGIKTPIGIKISGPDLNVIQSIGIDIENILGDFQNTDSVYSERSASGRYIKIDIDRRKAAQYGLDIEEIQSFIRTAVGGENITYTVEGLERYPVNLRFVSNSRDSIQSIKDLPIITPELEHISLEEVANIRYDSGPALIKTENARPTAWVYISTKNRDIGSYVEKAKKQLSEKLSLPSGYTLHWSGQYEYMERAQERMQILLPAMLLSIVILLYLSFKQFTHVFIILGTLPLALAGSIWLMFLFDYNFSVAVGVGFIALGGVAVEIGILMLVYLNQSYQSEIKKLESGLSLDEQTLIATIGNTACLRLRPILMTSIATIIGLVPIMFGTGTGSEIMQRIAGPMIGGLFSTLLLSLFVLPVIFLLVYRKKLENI